MKFFPKIFTCFLCLCVLTISCKREDITTAVNPVSESVMAQIAAKGFSTEGVRKVNNGYLVEGDIVLTEANLTEQSTSPDLIIATHEQYRTTNLVTGLPRTITVSVEGTLTGLAVWSNATNDFISRYNALGLQLTLQRVTSGGQVKIVGFYEGPSGGYITLGSAGFPSGGNPYPEIRMNTHPNAYGTNPNQGYITSVLQHEMGHCVGFRHTDYFNRALSCGGRKSNERAGSIGAVHIPGTPTGFDSESFMLACSAGTDRTFNANDVVALNYLY